MQQYALQINGKPVMTEQTFDVIDPALGKPFAACSKADAALVNKAVAAASEAFPAWRNTPLTERAALLNKLADAMEANMPALMELVTREVGKPMGGLNGIGSGMEVGGAIAWTRYTTSLQLPVDVLQDDDAMRVEVHRKPLGVIASVTPWNWPLMIGIWHIMPALLAGNTVVMKPSEFTPLSTIKMVELANEILPAGVLNLVAGDGETGSVLTTHKDVAKIVFTGSTATGKKIMEGASASLKRLTLELGGNDAGILLPDFDMALLPKLFTTCFHNNGQTCACLKRLYVHSSIYDEVANGLAAIARDTIVGNGLNEASQLGPVQNKMQFDKVIDLAAATKAQGATILSGGEPLDTEGYFFPPTVYANVKDGDRIVDEEQFGPLLPVISYDDIDEVISRANQNENGLGGSVWSADIGKAAELAKQLETGTVWINEHGAVQPNAPFGGVKQSGLGVEFGDYGLDEYVSLQTLMIPKAS
ncbi:aldehyde dehydrogenase family protein [Alteromonas lipolytica]|uniref:Aldehyde dehydrogenase n=1 Tax=Alteromonas lipolytica TaxID=1856405 RepID=A0A1E8FAR2_9ALTE|nr:aldehyde dehydrogenase family protein [Alteromonas lipolytica]OFI33000.1 aldehyde dehydrogenase [Alteromonas lipolytica]GGF63434.1 aldehyde dehydrogenase [Alteromonas lipolytica]